MADMTNITAISVEAQTGSPQSGHWLRRTWTNKAVRIAVFILLALTLTAAFFLMTPFGQQLIRSISTRKSMNAPVITAAQYDRWTDGTGDCPGKKAVFGSFGESRTLGGFTFNFGQMYMTEDYNDVGTTNVITGVKVTHHQGDGQSGQTIPNHVMQFVAVAEKDGVPLMHLYFANDSFYRSERYDEDEYRYLNGTGTFPWEVNEVYLHYRLWGYDVCDESHLLSRYGKDLADDYNRSMDEMKEYISPDNYQLITQMTPEILKTYDGYHLTRALRPDCYKIAYIAMVQCDAESVQTVYDPDGKTVTANDMKAWKGKNWECYVDDDGFGVEYFIMDSVSYSFYSLIDPKYYTLPRAVAAEDLPTGMGFSKDSDYEQYKQVFAPFVNKEWEYSYQD